MREPRDRDGTSSEGSSSTGGKPGGVTRTQGLAVQRKARGDAGAGAVPPEGGAGGVAALEGDGATPPRAEPFAWWLDDAAGVVQRRDSGEAARDAEGTISATLAAADTSGGHAVPEHLQERFGAAGADVSSVRLHTSETSARAAESVSARAYTVGQDVHFGAGEYAPGTADGDRLIAHELAHTLQQADGGGSPQFWLEISQPHDPAEAEADRVADAVLQGSGPLPTLSARGAQRKVMRWADPAAAEAVVRAIDAATPEQLGAIRVALGDAEGSADPLVPVEIPGYAGYVAREDLPILIARVRNRIGEAASSDGEERGPLRSGAGPLISARDAHIRLTEYVRPAEELSARVMRDVAEGRITHMEGREIASAGRTDARIATRERLSTGGRAMSEAVEPRGATLAELADRYAMRALAANPELRAQYGIQNLARGDAATERALTAIRDSEEVSRAIIAAAGRPNPTMSNAARVMRVAGPVLVGTQVALGSYRVLTAEEGEHMWTAGQEISGFAGGTLGSSAGGMVLSGLGAVAVMAGVTVSAPVAIVVSILVVGGMAMAGSMVGQSIWNQTVDHDSLRDWELEFARAIDAFARASTGDRIAAGMPMHSLAAGGGFGGLMERDRRRVEAEHRRPPPPPATSGGEAP